MVFASHSVASFDKRDRFGRMGAEPARVALLLKSGSLALLLNGWNEAAESELVHANPRLQDFLVTHPGTPLVVTTRESRIPPTVPGATVIDVRPLSQDQKALIVHSADLPTASDFLMDLDRNPALAEVASTIYPQEKRISCDHLSLSDRHCT